MRTAMPATSYLIKSPIIFIIWWYSESLVITFKILRFFFAATAHQFGYKSLFKTFFKPWKNEYREGLVGFSLIMGITIKSLLIFVETFFLIFVLLAEVTIFVIWIL